MQISKQNNKNNKNSKNMSEKLNPTRLNPLKEIPGTRP